MELRQVDLSQIYFPKNEWLWVRKTVSFSSTVPDAFLWGTLVNGKIWGWHPQGYDIEVITPTAQTQLLLLPTDGSELAAHGLFLKTTFTAIPPLDVEWVLAIKTLSERLQYDLAQKGLPSLWKEALEAVGLSPHLGVLAQRNRYSFLSFEECRFLYQKQWNLSAFELIEPWNTEIRKLFLNALQKWNLSAQQAKEAAHLVFILTKKHGNDFAAKILVSPLNNAEEFRSSLLQTAQPELASLSQSRLEKLRGLKLPPRTSIYGDPSFEDDTLKITHTPRNFGDFELFKSWVEDPKVAEKIRDLLLIYQ